MTFSTDGEAMYSFLRVPQHLSGWSNLVHGGVSATILDEIMSRVVLFRTRAIGVTRSMTMEFIRPVKVGEELVAEGRFIGGDDVRKVSAEGVLYNAVGEVCARSSGVFVLMSPQRLREKGIEGEELVAWINRLFERTNAG